jgi:hypothetical protein
VIPAGEAFVTTRTSPRFSIRGFLLALPVTASWRDGYLTADEELSEVIDGLVSGGYLFRGLDGRTELASLADPFAALLTVIRSFSQVTHANIEIPLDHEWGPIADGAGAVLEFRGQGEPRGELGDLHPCSVGDAGASSVATS